MASFSLSLLALLALATTSYGAVKQVNLDDNCDLTTTELAVSDKAVVTTAGNVPLGGSDCVKKFIALDTLNQCDDAVVLCVNVTAKNTMCYVNAEFTSNSKVLKLDCPPALPAAEWCVNGQREMTLRLYQNPIKEHSPYNFTANVFARCASYDINPNKGGQSSGGRMGPDEEDIIFVNVEEAVHNTRIIGIVVGVCLACMFLVALLITYYYYKNKPYSGVPSEA